MMCNSIETRDPELKKKYQKKDIHLQKKDTKLLMI